ncbi:NAD(P)-binding domain-containing protein [Streptomyces avermitilis]|uniref:NAD(P)-binding domain-containing protein n=1 Tax=Streptomyces avermitilis TaxID=33903 RepID=UPI0033AE0043
MPRNATPGVLIDCSTVSAQVSALIRNAAAKRGTDFLAATVSGNPKVIIAGKLTVAVSGSPEVFGQVEPLLAVLGRRVTYVGEGEAAASRQDRAQRLPRRRHPVARRDHHPLLDPRAGQELRHHAGTSERACGRWPVPGLICRPTPPVRRDARSPIRVRIRSATASSKGSRTSRSSLRYSDNERRCSASRPW